MMGWIRFVVKDSTAPAVELTIQVHIVAADPVAWGMAIVAGNSQPTPRDQGEVQCGQPFTLEVCAHDKFGHRQDTYATHIRKQIRRSHTQVTYTLHCKPVYSHREH